MAIQCSERSWLEQLAGNWDGETRLLAAEVYERWAAQLRASAETLAAQAAAPPAATERGTFRLQAESEDAVVALTRALGADFVQCEMVRREGGRVFKVHACLKLVPGCTKRTIHRAAKMIPVSTWRKRFRIVG